MNIPRSLWLGMLTVMLLMAITVGLSPPTQARQSQTAVSVAVSSHSMVTIAAEIASATSTNKEKISEAYNDNKVVGVNSTDGKNEVAATARSGSQNRAEQTMITNSLSSHYMADKNPVLLR